MNLTSMEVSMFYLCFSNRNYFEWMIKQILNSAFVSYQELWRSRGCYPPRPTAPSSISIISSHDTQPHSLIFKCIWLVWFLLSDKEVKGHLSLYLAKARGLKPEIGHLLQVCQLFVQCWEVNFEFITVVLKWRSFNRNEVLTACLWLPSVIILSYLELEVDI